MSRFHSLLIDPAYLDFIDADSAELSLIRVSSADSFSKVPAQKHRVSALPGSVMILPNDPGSIYELRLFKGKKSVASGFFVMPGYDHALVAQDLRTAWPIQFDQSFDLESRFLEKVDVSQLANESTQRQSADAGLSARIDDVQDQVDDKASQTALDALAGTVASVQTLAEVNQLNILEKADQSDLDILQTTVTGQGLTLAQKANQTALDALSTVVSGKATPADITAAIAALVDGAPDALNTLAELATALAGDQAQIADLLAALALRVRVDAVQSLTLAQQLQARQNISAEAVGVAAGLVAAITPASIGAATAVQGGKADTALQSADLAPVAFSGAYTALTGLPTIPSLSSSTPAAPTTGGTAGTANTAARGDHAHPLPTSAQITAAVLTGLASGSATAIAAADTLLTALEKLQAQASANAAGVASNAALLAPVPRKLGSSWYTSGRWYDMAYPYSSIISTAGATVGVLQFQRVFVIETVQVDQLAISVTGSAAGAGCIIGIYSDTAGSPASLIVKSGTLDCSSTGIKQFSTSQTLTAGTIVWLAFLAVGAAGATFRTVNTQYVPLYAGATTADVAAAGRLYIIGQTDLPNTVGVTPTLDIAAATPRVMFRAI